MAGKKDFSEISPKFRALYLKSVLDFYADRRGIDADWSSFDQAEDPFDIFQNFKEVRECVLSP